MKNPEANLTGHRKILVLFSNALLSSALFTVTPVFKICGLHWRDGSELTESAALAEDPYSVPSNHIRWFTTAHNCKILGFCTHPLKHLHSSDTHTHTQNREKDIKTKINL